MNWPTAYIVVVSLLVVGSLGWKLLDLASGDIQTGNLAAVVGVIGVVTNAVTGIVSYVFGKSEGEKTASNKRRNGMRK